MNQSKLFEILIEAVAQRAANKAVCCEMHATIEPTLRVTKDIATGAWYFYCHYCTCVFNGDIFSVVTTALRINVDDAAKLIASKSEYHSLLFNGANETDIRLYAKQYREQIELRVYFKAAQLKLHTTGNKDFINKLVKMGMLPSNTLDWEKNFIGLYDPHTIEIPEIIRGKLRRIGCQCAMFPYTNVGRVTAVELYPLEPDRSPVVIPVKPADSGVYMEENIAADVKQNHRDKVLFIAPSVKAARYLCHRHRAYHIKYPPVVAVIGYPLPVTFQAIRTVYLLTSDADPVSPKAVISALCATELIQSSSIQPELYVLPYEGSLDRELTVTRAVPAIKWVEDALKKANTEEQRHIMQIAVAPYMVRLNLLGINTPFAPTLTLANGVNISYSNQSMYATNPDGDRRILCNVQVHVLAKQRNLFHNRGHVYTVRVSCSNSALTVKLIDRDLKSPYTLRRAIVAADVTRVFDNKYIAFYTVANCRWPDVIDKLAEGKYKEENEYAERNTGYGADRSGGSDNNINGINTISFTRYVNSNREIAAAVRPDDHQPERLPECSPLAIGGSESASNTLAQGDGCTR